MQSQGQIGTVSVIAYLGIENFRSLRTVEMRELWKYVPIVGLNSSGKSNVLRALNLFFNGS
jgi:AAA15 family ATPase/GTPase